MGCRQAGRLLAFAGSILGLSIAGSAAALAASQNIDLDGKTANGNESNLSLTIVSNYPAKVKNKITNKAVGDSFTFRWVSAGPGGFSSAIPLGTSAGVGTIWTWETLQTIYSFTGSTCAKDACFTKTAGPDPVTSRGPFQSPGRALTPSDVTVSDASLTSSLITFFSPPTELVKVTTRVHPLASGELGYTTLIENNTSTSVSVAFTPGPPGCCPRAHQLNCDGTCVDYLEDPSHCGSCGTACTTGQACSSGSCVSLCPAGLTMCAGSCVDLQTDASHCGACGASCGGNQVCSAGRCITCRPPTATACDGRCVNIHTDAENCGGCGINCNALCPSSGQGACSQGQSCFCLPGGTTALAPETVEAPVCDFQAPEPQTIPAGGAVETCDTRAVLAKEVTSLLTVCGAAIPDGETDCPNGDSASQGMLSILRPDFLRPPGAAFVTPYHVDVTDPSGDKLIEPGETVGLKIALLNAGSSPITGVRATLSSPPADLTDDGNANPVAVSITGATATYPDILGRPLGTPGDCSQPAAPAFAVKNATPFMVAFPPGHPADVGRRFDLRVTGTVVQTGAPFDMQVPIVLGIASRCSLTDGDQRFDGVNGLLTPMASLVLPGDAVPYPAKPFAQGKTRPMKLQLLCAGANLSVSRIGPPEIVALSRAGVSIDIKTINLNDDANSSDPFFRYPSNGSTWIYNMRTRDLGKGRYVLTIRMADGQEYVTGFELN